MQEAHLPSNPDLAVDRAFARVGDARVHYRAAGAASSGPPLVMLHASPSSSRSLLPLISACAEPKRVCEALHRSSELAQRRRLLKR
ncbi:MAG: hypothetical protein AAGL49_04845, partial [Pseudomonadota bacterium]